MKCPKCEYHSFDHLDSCKKCGQSLVEHKEKFNLRGFFFSEHKVAAEPISFVDESYEDEETVEDGTIDFGFDFLDEEEPVAKAAGSTSLGGNDQEINIDQPFGVDSETLPADDRANDSDDKQAKGRKFTF